MKVYSDLYDVTIDFEQADFVLIESIEPYVFDGYCVGYDDDGNEWTIDCTSDGVNLHDLQIDSVQPVREYIN